MSGGGGLLPSLDLTRLVRRQLHVILALDCSGSMRGSKMASLNYALRAALPELREVAADNPEVDLRLRVVRFATEAAWHLEEPTPVDEATWPDLHAEGETAMGAAFGLMAGALGADALPGRQLPPLLVLASDGWPSDDVESGLSRLMATPHGAKAMRVALAIGSDVDEDVLERFIARPPMRPLQAHNAQDLVRQIRWATTVPVKAISSPRVGPEPAAALAKEAALRQPAPDVAGPSDLVW